MTLLPEGGFTKSALIRSQLEVNSVNVASETPTEIKTCFAAITPEYFSPTVVCLYVAAEIFLKLEVATTVLTLVKLI